MRFRWLYPMLLCTANVLSEIHFFSLDFLILFPICINSSSFPMIWLEVLFTYSVYDFFKEKEDIRVLHCMAHARRKFFEATNNDKAIAEYALEQIGLLYAIECKAKQQQLTPDEIFELRQTEALPILESLGKWMKETYVRALPKSTIGKALGYSIE